MNSLNDIVLRIHMTFLSNQHTVEWVASFENEVSPLSGEDFDNLVAMLEGVAREEHNNFIETINNNAIPDHLHARAANLSKFHDVIEQLKTEYTRWNG